MHVQLLGYLGTSTPEVATATKSNANNTFVNGHHIMHVNIWHAINLEVVQNPNMVTYEGEIKSTFKNVLLTSAPTKRGKNTEIKRDFGFEI